MTARHVFDSSITSTHTLIGFANPYLLCGECKQSVKYWHNPDRCGCVNESHYNHPCGHVADLIQGCPSWNPVEGCICSDKEKHDKE